MNESIIFDKVTKEYRLGKLGTLRSSISAMSDVIRRRDVQKPFTALRDVSFRVEAGDILGLIGPNGAGKTTILKLLSNITQPSSGTIKVNGRISSLIELGAGFHQELTGRENIYLNGSILGLRRHDIRQKLEAIIEFSGLEKFIDTPVKRYSSGMYVRLGFAVAAHIEPEVLLVDEVLAVGDASFRQKCLQRMVELKENGTTILFVSHNMPQVQQLCSRSMLLVNGQVHFLGDTGQTIEAYNRQILEASATPAGSVINKFDKQSARDTLVMSEIEVTDKAGNSIEGISSDEQLRIKMHYTTSERLINPVFTLHIVRQDGVNAVLINSELGGSKDWVFERQGELEIIFDPLQLTAGYYYTEIHAFIQGRSGWLGSASSSSFLVTDSNLLLDGISGVFYPNVNWSHHIGTGPKA